MTFMLIFTENTASRDLNKTEKSEWSFIAHLKKKMEDNFTFTRSIFLPEYDSNTKKNMRSYHYTTGAYRGFCQGEVVSK